MAVLGKRKAREAPSVSEDDAEAIFRRHFEAQFAPIDATPLGNEGEDNDDDDDDSDESGSDGEDDTQRERVDGEEAEEDDGEWGGFSEGDAEESDEEDTVEVVDHSKPQTAKPVAMSKRELKAFMSSRPPDQTSKPTSSTTSAPSSSSSTPLPEDAPSLLAQDLELRRLISESHLLSSLNNSHSSSSSAFSGAGADANGTEQKLFAAGRVRQKTTDLRVQALGSKDSVFTQKSMPMNMRKGIVAAAASREAKRRKQARENGVILEREVKTDGKRKRPGKKDMGIDMPGMGRFKGAQLKLNERDVKGIEGSRDAFGRRGGGRRR